MLRFIRSLFAWEEVRFQGVWSYQVNWITGRRRATRLAQGGHSPLDYDWLEGGPDGAVIIWGPGIVEIIPGRHG